MLRIVGAILIALVLTACAPTTLSGGPSDGHLRAESTVKTPGTIPQPVQNIASLPRPKAAGKTETYSVVVNNVRVQDLLFALARDARINVDIHSGISGYVTLNAIDQTLPQLLSRIAKQVDMRFELDGPNLAVMPDSPYLKSYKIDYVNISRDVTGTVSTNTQISTSALTTASGGASGTGGGNTSRLQIENKSKNHFWESLEKNIQDILRDTDKEKIIARRMADASESNTRATNLNAAANSTGAAAVIVSGPAIATVSGPGNQSSDSRAADKAQRLGSQDFKEYETIFASSVISNAEAGVLSIRATSRQHEKVQEFIDQVTRSARKQVLIEATIVEVNLSDTYQQGIDWTNLKTTGFGLTRASNTANVGSTVAPFSMVYKNATAGLSVFVDMLKGFGTTKVLSSPKLTVLNNQTATLKVSEDFVYFSVKQDVVPGSTAGTLSATSTTTTPQSVSIGFFMSLTAQVGDDDMVTLNVRPSISSISELKQDPNPVLTTVKNFVPQIRTREIESMLRVQSGDIAVLGGLMEDRMDNNSGQFPGLGNIPFFGEIFTTRNNASSKSELVIVLRPTVIRDASINGDFSNFATTLPNRDFFATDKVYKPFSGPDALQEPLK